MADRRAVARAALDAPVVPGLQLLRRLGAGVHAEVWLATDSASGDRVAVKVALPGAGARLTREAELLQRIDHEHVIRLRRVEPTPGGPALVLDHAGGGSLTALVAGRGGLDPEEATTVVVPIARALAAMHALGLVHGDVSGANVLFTRDGRPLLADLGVAADLAAPGSGVAELWGTPGWVEPSASAPSAGGDVWALGALLRFCLTGDPAGAAVADPGALRGRSAALVEVANACAATDPDRRPTALQVSRAVWDACPPEPVRLLDVHARLAPGLPAGAAELTRRIRQDAGEPGPEVPPRTRLRRPGGRVLGPVAVVAGAGLLGVTAALVVMPMLLQVGRPPVPEPGGSQRPPGAASTDLIASVVQVGQVGPQSSSGSAEPDLRQVLVALASARARALSAAAESALAEVDLPGSPALAQDTALVRRLVGSGVRLRGLTFAVGQVRPVHSTGAGWRVQAEVTTSAHTRVDLSGRNLGEVPAARVRQVTLELVRTASGWRVVSATAAP